LWKFCWLVVALVVERTEVDILALAVVAVL
jgi:hypothetical protein